MAAASAPADVHTAVRNVRRLLEILRELAEMAMELARAVHAEALNGGVSLAAVDRFTKIARAIRQLVALEARLAKALADVESGTWAEEDAVRRLNELAAEAKEAEAVETLEALARETEAEGVERERLIERIGDWRSERAIEKDFSERPVAEVLSRVCKDLGVAPDPALLAEPAMNGTFADAVRAYAAAREAGAPGALSHGPRTLDGVAAAGRTPNRLAEPRPPPGRIGSSSTYNHSARGSRASMSS